MSMTSATPKPRAGEHTPETDSRTIKRFTGDGKFLEEVIPAQYARHLEAERDSLRERERELERLLGDVLQYGGLYPSSSLFTRISAALAKARP